MKKFKLKEILNPTISLFLICLIVTLLLSCTNFLTKNSIELQKVKKDESAKKIVLPLAVTFEEKKYSDITYSIGTNADGKLVGFTFNTTSKGYGGTIEVMTGISADSKITGVTILSQNETPGLGANITNDNFINQFYRDIPQDGFKIKKGNAQNNNEINAITGATISSNTVNDAINEAITQYRKISSNGGYVNE